MNTNPMTSVRNSMPNIFTLGASNYLKYRKSEEQRQEALEKVKIIDQTANYNELQLDYCQSALMNFKINFKLIEANSHNIYNLITENSAEFQQTKQIEDSVMEKHHDLLKDFDNITKRHSILKMQLMPIEAPNDQMMRMIENIYEELIVLNEKRREIEAVIRNLREVMT